MNQTFTPRVKQDGAVLIVALIILLILTILGIAGLNAMTLEERMAAGYQQTEIAFQASESVINSAIFLGTRDVVDSSGKVIGTNPRYDQAQDPFYTVMTTTACNETRSDTLDIDGTDVLGHADVNSNASMAYAGITTDPKYIPRGNDLGQDTLVFVITAASEYRVGGTRTARSSQTQLLTITVPSTGGGTGSDCVYTPPTI